MTRNVFEHPRIWDYAYLFTSRLKSELKKKLPFPGNRILDVGCGTQPHRYLYGDQKIIHGIDVIPNSKTDVLASAENIPFVDKTFDTVFMFTALECVPNPVRAIEEISRVLKTNGHFLICEHQTWYSYDPYVYYRFTKNAYELWALQNQLQIISIKPLGSFWARTGIRINRAIMPYTGSYFIWLSPLLRLLILVLNLILKPIDRIFQMDGESIGYLVLLKKK